ncbi:hypothetical protein PYJP_06410 [Pyrofollis japonicus]|uniref:CRISPR system precrRNA processing endoribonuclease RAMP protein Cas6 n=1 Tax=Pyrofollis japonicus TaxID=3060460 RepID=UPI00295BBD71|nr:CRISPR system precrRNA processing endoribonuclease RAMP protein Cas6 [Pyrofollis japonicus]BEP17289.1 hypothetical protein PYJP_06410 [Pyrofollis japonicus]
MGVEARFYVVNLVFRVVSRVKLVAWSGAVAGKIVYDSLSLAGTVLPEGGLFRVSPIYPAEGGFVPVSGFLAPGERYRLRAVFWGKAGEVPAHVLARGFTTGVVFNKDIIVEGLDMREEVVDAPLPEPPSDPGDPVAAVIVARHGATFYRFHGAIVSYPSPWRLVASIARRLSATTGLDYKPLVAAIQPCLELAQDNTKKARIRLTHGKEIKVFTGEARYHLVCGEKLAEAAKKLLGAALLTGAGGSPGLGLGEVQAITIQPPRHPTPPPVEPWAEETTE